MKLAVHELTAAPYDLSPVQTGWGEYAWKYSDYHAILAYVQKKECILLGGDILTMDLKQTYDNWYYNPDPSKTDYENMRQSVAVTEEYLKCYQKCRGTEFYIVFVLRGRAL